MPPDDSLKLPEAQALDDRIYQVFVEVCRSYQTFLRDFSKRTRSRETDEHPIAQWLLYLLLLSYDVGFVSLAILREGLDRQLLTMKRQAFEYAVKAEYLVMFPEKALKQYHSIPLKQQEFFRRLGLDEASSEAARLLAEHIRQLRLVMPDVQPTYGEVSMFDMLRAVDPRNYSERYARHYWLPSATMHGLQMGWLDVLRQLPDGRLWVSHHSMLTTRNENALVLIDSLIRVLVLTGRHFKLHGTHWVAMIARYNAIVTSFSPDADPVDLHGDLSELFAAAESHPSKPAAHRSQNLRIRLGPAGELRDSSANADESVLMTQLQSEPFDAIQSLAAYADLVVGEIVMRSMPNAIALGADFGGLEPRHLIRIALAMDQLPDDLESSLQVLNELRDQLASNGTIDESAASRFLNTLPPEIAALGSTPAANVKDSLFGGRTALAIELIRCRHSPKMERTAFFEDLRQQLIAARNSVVAE